MKVRSEPHDARIEDSARLNLRAVMVSVEVGNVRFEIGEVLMGDTNSVGYVPRAREISRKKGIAVGGQMISVIDIR